MIFPALLIGVACVLVVARDFRRYPTDPFSVMRAPLAAAWAVGWLTYGLNLANFPHPAPSTLVILAASCALTIASVPGPPVSGRQTSRPGGEFDLPRPYFLLLVAFSIALIAWDLWNVLPRIIEVGITNGLIGARVDRGIKAGVYRLPGIEVAHAIAAVTGVIGYAFWIRDGLRTGILAAILGLAATLLSTGRFDVVGYGVWCFVIDILMRPRAQRIVMWSTARLFVLLGLFFLVHGELLRKTEALGTFAAMSKEERQELTNQDVLLGVSGPPSAGMASGGSSSGARAAQRARAEASPERPRPCPRWDAGAKQANTSLQQMSRHLRVVATYFAGPMAAFDRVQCENQPAVRTVIFYWPTKIGRLLGLIEPIRTYAVDPFIDIGVPFNNYTVAYSFLSELGLATGMLVMLMIAVTCRLFARWAVGPDRGIALNVAGVAPMSIALRAPWTNAFFDGTLVVWIGVCLTGLAIGAVLARRRPRRAHVAAASAVRS